MFKPGLPAAWVEALGPVHQLIFRKYYFDELYDILFVRPAFWLGQFFWKRGDVGIIDAYGPDGLASAHAASPADSAGYRAGTCSITPWRCSSACWF